MHAPPSEDITSVNFSSYCTRTRARIRFSKWTNYILVCLQITHVIIYRTSNIAFYGSCTSGADLCLRCYPSELYTPVSTYGILIFQEQKSMKYEYDRKLINFVTNDVLDSINNPLKQLKEIFNVQHIFRLILIFSLITSY